MASGQIKRSEIAENDLYKGVRDSAKKTITTLNKLNVGLKKTGKIIQKDLTGNLSKTTAGINKLSTAVKKADAVMAQSIKVDKAKTEAQKTLISAEREMERLKQEKLKTQKMETANAQQLQRIQEKQNAKAKKNAKAVKDQTSAYKKLVIATRDQKNQSKELGAQMLKLEQSGKKNTNQYRKLNTEFRKVTASAKKGDKALKKLDRRVGDNFRNVGNYRGALGKLSGAFASLGLAMGGAMIIRKVFSVIKDFDQAQANLASVLGVNREQMEGLTDQAKKLGATTRFTASQVSELHLELAKLGFSQQSVEDMTGAVLNLAGATGADLGESATVVGSTLRAFGMDATEAGRITDVMSKSFSSSSLDMSKFSTSMATVAPVAKSAGLNIEQTTAMLGALTDNGIEASTAGTGLRNIFLRLAKSGQSYSSAMKQIDESTNKSKTAMELFGVKGSSVALILAEQGEHVDELTQKLYASAGATETMANMQLDTLGGSIDLLSSAWEGYILNASDAGGIGDTLKNVFKGLADNLAMLLDIVVMAGKAWVTYKAVTILSTQANNLLGMSFMRLGRSAGGAKGVLLGIKGAVKGVGGAFKKLGTALKANIFGIIILVLYKLYNAMNAVVTEAEQMAEIQESLNNISSQSAQKLEEEQLQLNVLVTAIKGANKENGERDRLITELNSKYGTTLKNIQDEDKFLKELEATYKKVNAQIRFKIRLDEVRQKFGLVGNEIAKIEMENIRLEDKMMGVWGNADEGFWSGVAEFSQWAIDSENSAGTLVRQMEENQAVIDELKGQKSDLEYELIQLMKQDLATETGTGGTGGTGGAGGGGGAGAKTFNTDLKTTYELQQEINKAFEKEVELHQKLSKFKRDRQIKDLDMLIEKEMELIDLQISVGKDPDMSTIENFLKEKQKIVIAGIEAERDIVKSKESKIIDDRYLNETNRLYKQKTKLLEQEDLTVDAKKKINDNYTREIGEAGTAYLKEVEGQKKREEEINATFHEKIVDATHAHEKKLAEIRNRTAEIINAKFDREAEEYRLKLLESKKTDEQVELAYTAFLIKQTEERIKKLQKLGVDTLDLEIELAELKRKKIGDIEKDATEDSKKIMEDQIAIIKGLTDAFNYFADKRIAKIDEEIKKSQERYNTYVDLAKNGNINAQQSLAVEAKIIAESNRKKEKLEKQKQRVQLASDAMVAYIRNAEDPDVKNPLLKTFSDITLLTQFIQNLPFFEDGIEDTGATGNGIDGRGGFLSVLHPNERVLTKKQNAMIGDISNDELAKVASFNRSGEMLGNTLKVENGFNTNEVVKRLESLENTLKNKPETNIEFERIIGGAMQIVRETKNGNTKVYNRYRV